MQKKIWIPFLLFISAIGVVTGSVSFVFPELYSPAWLVSFAFLASLYALSFFVFQKTSTLNPKSMVLVFLALTTGKMLLAMIYVLVMVMGFGIDSFSDSLFFVILYLLFLALEVVVFAHCIKLKKQ